MPRLRATETRYIEAEVSVDEIVEHVRRHCFHVFKFPGEYVRNGKWEIDHGGHGSGYQEVLREITPEEKIQLDSLNLILAALHAKVERR